MSPLPVSLAPEALAEWVEHAIAESGRTAWIEIGWLYPDALPAEILTFVDAATVHLVMRDLWLSDPRHAADLTNSTVTSALVEYGEAQAGREDQQLRALIQAWVAGHQLTQASTR